MSLRPRFVALVVVAGLVPLACSSNENTIRPSDTTTGTIDRSTSTTSTVPRSESTEPGTTGDDGIPGLWLATGSGIVDSDGQVWAEPKAGETLRNPIDDGVGGVAYLRCIADRVTCTIEDARTRGKVPAVLGEADTLLAAGSYQQRRVLLTSWTDPSLVPSFEANVSGLVARLVEMDSGQVTPMLGWFGWETGPFSGDVESDRFATCLGEGEVCQAGTAIGMTPFVPIVGREPATVTSLALDPGATRLTWIETEPMAGVVTAVVADLATANVAATVLSSPTAEPADDAVTDGTCVAIRTGAEVEMVQLGPDGVRGTVEVPDDVAEMAIRTAGGGGAANDIL